jgi:hypothetical protein
VDQKKRVVEVPAAPPPWFFVVSETLMAPPATAVAGALSVETARSGPI